MSEYIINGTLLTNIADAVRSVDGSASTLTPTQMEARLKAVKSSIDSALSALTDKKVEVPSGSTVHALASLIASIEAGGVDLGDYFTDIFIGTLTPAEDISCGAACSALGIDYRHMIVIVANNEFRTTIDGNHIRYAVWPRWCYVGLWRMLYGKGTSPSDEAWSNSSSSTGGSSYSLAAGVRYEIFALSGPY